MCVLIVSGNSRGLLLMSLMSHGSIPRDLLKRFEVLKKCKNKFDCLVFEMLFIRTLKVVL